MKKKGLIISTVVMVVVLIASLTTATYAQFSTQAEAKIENISITTTSTEGLQIGVITTNKETYTSGYTNGTITYNKTENFGSEEGNDGWGTLADFSNLKTSLGTVEDAVTLVTQQNITDGKYTGKVFKVATFEQGAVYELNDSNKMVTSSDDSAQEGKTYYVADTSFAVGSYLVPLAYDGNIEPTCYAIASANGDGTAKSADYLVLPIGVRATMDVYAILCTITVTPDVTLIANQQYKPGMAAACFITLFDGTKTQTVQAYPNVTKGASASTGDGKDATNWTYSFVVMGTKDKVITALTAKDITYTIWIEGEDDMCDNLTAGSGFSVDIAYKYEKSAENLTYAANAITVKEGTTNAGAYNIIF